MHRVGVVEAQRRVRHRDRADLVVLDVFEEAALVHVRVVHDLADIAHRRQRDAVPLGDREDLDFAEVCVQAAISASVSSRFFDAGRGC